MADYLSKAEFSRTLARMQEMRDSDSIDLVSFMGGDMEMFLGFGLRDFEPVTCTIEQLAHAICYQCLQFNGELDQEALAKIWACRRKFLLVGPGSDEVVAEQQRRFHYQQTITRIAEAVA